MPGWTVALAAFARRARRRLAPADPLGAVVSTALVVAGPAATVL